MAPLLGEQEQVRKECFPVLVRKRCDYKAVRLTWGTQLLDQSLHFPPSLWGQAGPLCYWQARGAIHKRTRSCPVCHSLDCETPEVQNLTSPHAVQRQNWNHWGPCETCPVQMYCIEISILAKFSGNLCV